MSYLIDVNFGNSLNEVSKKILAFFIKYPNPLNTEILIDKMQEEGIRYSKRYLYSTLKKLEKAGYLIKKSTGKLRTYELNQAILGKIAERIKSNIVFENYLDEELNVFNQMNLDEKINFIHNIFIFCELMKIKDAIELYQNSDKEFEVNNRFDKYEKLKVKTTSYLYDDFKKHGKKYIQKTYEIIDKLIDIYFEEIGFIDKFYK